MNCFYELKQNILKNVLFFGKMFMK